MVEAVKCDPVHEPYYSPTKAQTVIQIFISLDSPIGVEIIVVGALLRPNGFKMVIM